MLRIIVQKPFQLVAEEAYFQLLAPGVVVPVEAGPLFSSVVLQQLFLWAQAQAQAQVQEQGLAQPLGLLARKSTPHQWLGKAALSLFEAVKT
jgi:hypothetical protein